METIRRFQTLNDSIAFLTKRHKHISKSSEGVYGMKFVKFNGERILVEEINGLRLFNYHIHDDTDLVITQFASGISFRGQSKITMTSRLFLPNMLLLNIYDHGAEFFTEDSIDFAYVINDISNDVKFLDSMIHPKIKAGHGSLRGHWMRDCDKLDKLLEELSQGRKIFFKNEVETLVDMDDQLEI